MTAPIDYTAVLADLLAKRGQIDAAIEVIRSLIGGGAAAAEGELASNGGKGGDDPSVPSLTPAPQPRASTTLQTDTFFRLSTSEAIKKFLGMVKRPQKPPAIAEALRNGGQVHATDQKTAYLNVQTALRRGKDRDFVQTRNKEWGLAEWYGGKSKGDGE